MPRVNQAQKRHSRPINQDQEKVNRAARHDRRARLQRVRESELRQYP